jgi:hypothetical protein
MLMSNSPDISIWKMELSGWEMVTNERLNYGIDARCHCLEPGAPQYPRESREGPGDTQKPSRIEARGQVAIYAVKCISEHRQLFIEPGMEHTHSPSGFTRACHSGAS